MDKVWRNRGGWKQKNFIKELYVKQKQLNNIKLKFKQFDRAVKRTETRLLSVSKMFNLCINDMLISVLENKKAWV